MNVVHDVRQYREQILAEMLIPAYCSDDMTVMEKDLQERRRDLRSVCSVMSEVFVMSPRGWRFFAPAIVTDISASGLALRMDLAPKGHHRLHVRNTYFHAEVHVRHTNQLECGVRVGCEFLERLEWQADRVIRF